MPNVIQIRDKEGNALYPITDSSLVIGLKDGGIMENVMAWDGTSAPTVANIPAGVQVEYNSTTYTGTLAASGTTSGYIYLVASATQQGEYDRYIVNAAGGSYTWVALSSTQIVSPTIADNLTTNDATKALSAKQGKVLNDELSQLGQELSLTNQAFDHSIVKGEEITPTGTLSNQFIKKTTGELVSFNGYSVKYYAVTPGQILVCNLYSNSSFSSTVASLCFYNDVNFSGQTKVQVIPFIKAPADNSRYVVIVPEGAAYLAINQQSGTLNNVWSVLYNQNVIDTLTGTISNVFSELKIDYSFYDFALKSVENTYNNYYINSQGAFALSSSVFKIREYSVVPGNVVRITNKNHLGASRSFAFYKGVNGLNPVYVGPSVSSAKDSYVFVVPDGANYLCITEYNNVQTGAEDGTRVEHEKFYEQTKQQGQDIDTFDNRFVEYKKTGDTVVIGGLFKDKKIGITIGRGGANNLVDFRNIFTCDVTSSIDSPTNVSYIIPSVGDMHGPFRFRNDGGTTTIDFTGGNHAYSSGTVKTAISNYFKVYADGKLLDTNASGFCRSIRFEWQNDVKPGNAYAAADSYALRETHKMSFDGINFEEWVDLEPLVNINMGLWYGFQLIPISGQTNIQFPGAPNRLNYDVSAYRESGDKYCKKVIAESDVALLSMMIDNNFDLGERNLSDATNRGAFMSSDTKKSYFTIVSSSTYSANMAQGAHYWLHGWWEILPK